MGLDYALYTIVFNALATTILLITVIIATKQIKETRRATYATAFKSIYDLLQTDEIRKARAYVFEHLSNKKFESWTQDDKKTAEKVCHSYDSVAIMIKNGMLPVEIIADSWGDSLRRSWKILAPLVSSYRIQRNSNEFWDDFQWLAKQAEKFKKNIHIGE